MVYGIQQRLGSLIDHYTVLCLTLALVILSLIGVGDVRVAGMAGIFLCLAGITRGDARVDLRILLSLILYDLAAREYFSRKRRLNRYRYRRKL